VLGNPQALGKMFYNMPIILIGYRRLKVDELKKQLKSTSIMDDVV